MVRFETERGFEMATESEKFERPGTCQHVTVSDAALVEREALVRRTWGDADPIKCPDCLEYLYPHGEPGDGKVYVGEPYGAGAD